MPSTSSPSTGSPACIFVPSEAAFDDSRLLQGHESRHFMTTKQFKQWAQSHPDVQLRPRTEQPASVAAVKQQPQPTTRTTGTTTATEVVQPLQQQQAGKAAPATATSIQSKVEPFRAPQHPTSHMLQSIPPRAPSQSSRSNILTYTLHLATTARLESYTHPNGAQALLQTAESSKDTQSQKAQVDEEWLESELKAQGMWKLGASLLKANRREGHLAPSVERRVALACLTEDLLVHPAPERAFAAVTSDDEATPSDAVESLDALKPLTSPNTTTLYLTTTTARSDAAKGLPSSVAQSLINRKFGQARSEDAAPETADSKDKSDKPAPGSSSPNDAGAGPSGRTDATGELTATPHMDYRIVRSQTMRSRAKSIYAKSILPSLSGAADKGAESLSSKSFCRRHRVAACSVCTLVASTKVETRRAPIPGQGLDSHAGGLIGGKRPLAELVPKFLDLSAHLLRDLRDRANAALTASLQDDTTGTRANVTNADLQATAAWYSLLYSMLTQACLEGYLVDGWTGTHGIETLFGVGCGVWEGRGWAKRIEEQRRAEEDALNAAKNGGGGHVEVVEGEPGSEYDSDSSDDDEDGDDSDDATAAEQEVRLERERDRTKLVDAAQQLFGSRDVAQAEFERGMRDRIHEFLNVPEDATLETHLLALNAKYPVSSFETDMVDFLQCTQRFLGKPALAKYESLANTSLAPSGTSPSSAAADTDPDPFALSKYFARVESSGASTPAAVQWPSSEPGVSGVAVDVPLHAASSTDGVSDAKRRKMD